MKRWPWVRELAGEVKFILKHGNYQVLGEWILARLQNSQDPVYIKVRRQGLWVRPNTTDLIVTRCCFEFGEFDPLAKLMFKKQVKLIVDGGAYIGASSIRLASLFRDAKVLAVEPSPENFAILKMNARDISNIVPVNAALSDEDGFVEIYNNFGRHWGVTTLRLSTDAVSESVVAYSLESLTRAYAKDEIIDILKLDVEGAELPILQGSSRWIHRIGAMVVETHDFLRPGCTRAFFECSGDFVDVHLDGEKFLCFNKEHVCDYVD
jgi:FkbM family methyltransferase